MTRPLEAQVAEGRSGLCRVSEPGLSPFEKHLPSSLNEVDRWKARSRYLNGAGAADSHQHREQLEVRVDRRVRHEPTREAELTVRRRRRILHNHTKTRHR